MVATPQGDASEKKNRSSRKKHTPSTHYAAPQPLEYWDPVAGRWVAHTPRPASDVSAPRTGRARRITSEDAAQARPYEGPRPDISDSPSAYASLEHEESRPGRFTSFFSQQSGMNVGQQALGSLLGKKMLYDPYTGQPLQQESPSPQEKTRRDRVKTAGKVVRYSLLAVVLICICCVVATSVTFMRNVSRTDALSAHMVGRTAGINWLLVGSDSRSGLSSSTQSNLGVGGDLGSQRTDTIMLLHIPFIGGGDRMLISVPRDSYVNIPGRGMGKINAAYAYGGPQLLVQTFEQATGVHVHHYMEISLGGFAKMTDALGGVTICPTESMEDPLANLDITAGCQKADGKTALGFVRSRNTPRGDLDRVEHQREFMNSFVSTVTHPRTFLNPVKMFRLSRSAGQSLTVDNGSRLFDLSILAIAMSMGYKTTTVPVGESRDTEVGSVLMWTKDTQFFWDNIARDSHVPDYLLTGR